MITLSELIKIGTIGKSHALKGEMNVAFDLDVDLEGLPYVVIDVDGIFVPFFITDYRFKNNMNALLTLEDVANDTAVRRFYNCEVYLHKRHSEHIIEDEEEDGFNPRMFLGYTIVLEGGAVIGEIEEVDDSTDNVLYSVGEHLIPVAAIGVVDIDHEELTITAQLPEGLLELID